jgi:hypothetical protein
MNLLASLLYSIPAPLPPKPRRIVAPEMRKKEPKPLFRRSETTYGTVQPRILAHLQSVGKAEPNEIAEALDLNGDSVRRGIRALHRKKLIVQLRASDVGQHVPALWGAR